MKRYALQCAYDGSKFYGWQIQKQSPTVQEVLETALCSIAKEKIKVVGSGRTDAGVHALAQVAHFDFPLTMTPQTIKLAMQSKLPPSLQVQNLIEVESSFHARFDALARSYRYIITLQPNPFNLSFKASFARTRIECEKMVACIPFLMGKQDFTSFAKPNPEITNHICEIYDLSIKQVQDDIILEITANRFLHHMVRRIVGALIAVSHKSLEPQIIQQWLSKKKHEQANYITAYPNGLYLFRVMYPKELFTPETGNGNH